jgi:hypothetical protein
VRKKASAIKGKTLTIDSLIKREKKLIVANAQ